MILRTSIFPHGIKIRHMGNPLKVNIYKSSRSPIGIHYGRTRPIDDPIFRRRKPTALYRIRVTWK